MLPRGDRRRFLGVDESNHGREPELFVGVYSNNEMSLNPVLLPKKKSRQGDIAAELANGDYFRYVFFSGPFRSFFGDDLVKVIALSELIRAGNGLERVIYDGSMDDPAKLNFIPRFVTQRPMPSIDVYPQADVHFPIVNHADRIARLLFRYYSKKGILHEKYARRLIEPDLNRYQQLLR